MKRRAQLISTGLRLEYATLLWNVIGVVILIVAALGARSIALAGFGFDSLIEIGASAVVVWELKAIAQERRRRALRLIGIAFVILVAYLIALTALALVDHVHPLHSRMGIAWTAITSAAMFLLAYGKKRTGKALANPVLISESKVTVIDGVLAVAVLVGLSLNALFSWWWADPLAGLVIAYYAIQEARALLTH